MKYLLLILISATALAESQDIPINVIKRGATIDSETGKVKYADGFTPDDVVRQLQVNVSACMQELMALKQPKPAKTKKKDQKVEDVIKEAK